MARFVRISTRQSPQKTQFYKSSLIREHKKFQRLLLKSVATSKMRWRKSLSLINP